MASAGLGVRAAPQLLPIGTSSAEASDPPPALQAEHQAGTQPALPGGAVPTGCEIHSISSDPRDSTQQEPRRASAPSAPVHPHSTSPCSPGGLGLPGAFHLSLFSPWFSFWVFLHRKSVFCFCFPGDVRTQSTVVGTCACSAFQVKLKTSQALTVGLEEVDFLPQSSCPCVSVLSYSVCCPLCHPSALFSRAHRLFWDRGEGKMGNR